MPVRVRRLCMSMCECVHKCIQTDLHTVVGDGAEGVLLDELDEVVLSVAGSAARLDVLRRDRGEERQLTGHVHVSDSLGVLGLQRVVPAIEVDLHDYISKMLSGAARS